MKESFLSGQSTKEIISGQSTQMPGSLISDPATFSKQLIFTDPSGKYYSLN